MAGKTAIDHMTAHGDMSGGPACWHLASHIRLWLTAALGLAVDLWTKHWAFAHLDPDPAQAPLVVIPNILTLRQSLNSGALFGLGRGLTTLFIGASIVALGFVFFLFIHSGRDRRSLHIALGLVLAGALGNLYDRTQVVADVVTYTVNGRAGSVAGRIIEKNERGILIGSWPEGTHPRLIRTEWQPEITQQGVVRDFVKMEPKITIWPWVFNVADSLLVIGVGVLMLNFWWERRPGAPAVQPPAESIPPAAK
jgi:signal peptidase II